MATGTQTQQYQVSDCLPNVQSWELPFRHRVNLTDGRKGRYLVCVSWQPYRMSIQGEVGQGFQLKAAGWVRITKRGDMGRMSSDLAASYGPQHAVYDAHRAWVAAGKPDSFEWTD